MKSPLDFPAALARLPVRRAPLWAVLATLAALAFGRPPARAAVTEAWVHRYNNVVSNATDQAFKVVRDAAGDIIVTGTTDNRTTGLDMLTIKYSGADGSVLWQQRYNGPANNEDYPQALAVDGNGNVIVTGVSDASRIRHVWFGGGYYTAKYAAVGFRGTILTSADGVNWVQRLSETRCSLFGIARELGRPAQ